MTKSAKGLPANRESEVRDAQALINAGFTALAMREGVTLAELNAYQRQAAFLSEAVANRYREGEI
jgi:hypothetical protein